MMKRVRHVTVAGVLIAGTVAGMSGGSFGIQAAVSGDWPEWRGPTRDGRSDETNLPSSWAPAGEGLAWRIPLGGRAAPVVFGDRIYLLTSSGDAATTRERLVAIDAESGRVLWEQHFAIYLSDVPQGRVAWASPAVDPATGIVYVFTVGAQLFALSPEGKILWDRSLPEEYGAVTTHGGRTTPPIVEGDMVILNALVLAWGDLGRPGNRYFAFDTRTGQTIWISSPQSRHLDTNFSTPIVADIPSTESGMGPTRALIVGGTDGAFHALQLRTGVPLWKVDTSKRAILNSALYRDGTAYITHGEENIGTTEMGMVAAIDATGAGALTEDAYRWKTYGFMPTFASPVMDDQRLYTVDNGAMVGAFDLKTGKRLWTHRLGTLQKSSPVLADGKLYVGTENGRFFILRPSATGVEVLDDDLLGSATAPEAIIASPVIADGRVYVTSMEAMYAIGSRRASGAGARAAGAAGPSPSAGAGPVAHVQVFPYETLLTPGASTQFEVRLFDAQGNRVAAQPTPVVWTVEQLGGALTADGAYVAPASGSGAGFVKATVNGVTGQARVRSIEPLPWSLDFDAPGAEAPPMWWVGANGKVFRRTVEGVGDVLVRPRDDTVGRRAKVLMGLPTWEGYTVEADVRGREQRRQRGDAGLINQRYGLVLFGNAQKLELHPWQAADEMTVRVPFEWDADRWYRMKLRVDNLPDGTTHVRGKVWPVDGSEPAAWTIEKVDTVPHRMGSPGLYADGISELFFDNVRVYGNQ